MDDNLKKLFIEEGLNDYQVAKLLHVSRSSLAKWRHENNILSKTTKKGLSLNLCPILYQRLLKGETLTDLALEFGVGRSSLSRLLLKNGFHVPEYRPKHPDWVTNYKLTQIQEQVLLGELFGDGGLALTSSKSAYYYCGHAVKQHDFVVWKAKIFAPLTSRLSLSQISTMGTWTSPEFYSWHCEAYVPGRQDKLLTSSLAEKMTPLSLAVWYMGDGSLNRNVGLFNVGLNQPNILEIAKTISEIFGLTFEVRTYDKIYHVRALNSDRFFVIIAPYLLSIFRYKVPKQYQSLIDNQQPSLGGNSLEGSTTGGSLSLDNQIWR